MLCLLVTTTAARAVPFAAVLREQGFAVDVAAPLPSEGDARRTYNAIFFERLASRDDTLRLCRTITRNVASPTSFVAMLGVPDADDEASVLSSAGVQTCLPDDPALFAGRMRFLQNALHVRDSLAGVMEDLRASEVRYKMVIEALDEGLLVQAADGTVTAYNPACMRILGMNDAQIRARNWHGGDFRVHTPDGQRVEPTQMPGWIAMRDGKPVLGRILALTNPSGQTAWVSVNSHPVRGAAAASGAAVVSTLRDITEQRRLEMQLMAADRLAALGRLAASVGHEINNPLTYILGSLQTLGERLRERGLAEEANLVEDALEGTERVRVIVRDLKVFATRRADAVVAVELPRLVASCGRMAKREIQQRARLVCRFGDTPRVRANEARLAQVLLNLLVNAAQAIPEGHAELHEITVTTRLEDDGRVAICVHDTGVGILPEHLPHVTEPFFTTKADLGGTGLGLSICSLLVAAQGGELTIDSAPGSGTTVTVRLAAATEIAAQEASPPPAEHVARRRVLVVDDEERIARIVGECLAGCEVTVATSGREAVRCVDELGDFDVIVCDLMMPDLTGMDVHEHVRRTRPGLERRMVFITGGAFTPRAAQFVASLEDRCLEKPFSPEDLVRMVERVAAPA